MEIQHRPDVFGHRGAGGTSHRGGIAFPAGCPVGDSPAPRQIAVDGIMGGGLVGDDVRPDASPHQFRKDLRGIAEQAYRYWLLFAAGLLDDRQRLLQRGRLAVEVAGAQPHLDARGLAFDDQAADAPAITAASGCAPPMPPRPAVRIHLARERSAEMAPPHLDERFVGALNDALAADIDPRTRGHLAVHHEPLTIELMKMLPGRPVRHQVGIGDQHAGASAWVRNTPTGLPDCTSSVSSASSRLQRGDDGVETVPVTRRPADAAIDHQFLRTLRHGGVQVVHQHAQRRLGEPGFGVQRRRRAAR